MSLPNQLLTGAKAMPSINDPTDNAGESETWWLATFFRPGSTWDRAARYSAYCLIAVAVLSGFAYVYNYGVNVYWGDDWDTLPALFEQHAAGTLTIAKFWELHARTPPLLSKAGHVRLRIAHPRQCPGQHVPDRISACWRFWPFTLLPSAGSSPAAWPSG